MSSKAVEVIQTLLRLLMQKNLFDVQGKIILITGATGTLISKIAIALAEAGASVILLARNPEKIESLVSTIQEKGGQAIGLSVNILDKAAMEVAAEQILAQYGRIDILINGAGGNRVDASTMPHERSYFDLPEEALRYVFDLNFTSAVLSSQVFAKPMSLAKSGIILNISSMAAYQPMTRVLAYAAAKAAINNFTHWLAVYMAQDYSPDIRVNAIAPGFFLAEQNRYLLLDEDTGHLTERGQKIIDHTPMNRFGTPDDLLGTVFWLVSDASRFVTGIVVPVDGGFMAYKGV
jgi:NAD(P)-dependent dehydrogenase (short-subunit alcohol dehydrogenase family)